jgi:hypothetical protein
LRARRRIRDGARRDDSGWPRHRRGRAGEGLALRDRSRRQAARCWPARLKGGGNSNLPARADLLVAAPLVSIPLIAQKLKISPQAAQLLVAEFGSSRRVITGRKRYRAWTIG